MNRLGLSNFVPFLILVSCHVSLVGQSQHTISIDPISLSSSIVQLEYENNFEAQQSFFVRAHYDMDNIHSTGVQIGIDTTGGFIDGLPIIDTGSHERLRLDLGYRKYFKDSGYYGSGLFVEGSINYERVFNIERDKPFLDNRNVYGGGLGVGYRYALPFNMIIGIEYIGTITYNPAQDSSDNIDGNNFLFLNIGYVFNRRDRG